MCLRQDFRSIFISIIVTAVFSLQEVCATSELSFVLEPFNYVSHDFIPDTWGQQVYNDQGYINLNFTDPGFGLFEDRALKVEYEVVQTENWGGYVALEWQLPDVEVYNCMGATHLSIHFKILEEQSSPGRVHFRLIALDGSDCGSDCGSDDAMEVYYSFHYILDDLKNSEWQEIQVPMQGGSDSGSPFLRTGWSGQVGNDILDPNYLKGFRLELSIDSLGAIGSASSGIFLLDQLACVGAEDLLGAPFFGIPEGLYEDAVLQGSWLEGIYSSELSKNMTHADFLDGVFRVNYTVDQINSTDDDGSFGGLLSFRHTTPAASYYNLSLASQILLNYNVTKSASDHGRARFEITLEGLESDQTISQQFPNLLDGDDGSAGTLDLALFGEDVLLDTSRIKGYRLNFWIDGQGEIGSAVTGVVTISDLTAVIPPPEEGPDDGKADAEEPACFVESGLMLLDKPEIFTKKEFLGGSCCEICDADENCLYAIASLVIHSSHCYLASHLEPSVVALQNTEFSQTQIQAFVTNDPEKRGDYCEVCHCDRVTRTINCRGKDLAITPIIFSRNWQPTELDLRENPRLVILDTHALESVDSNLEILRLPENLRHLSPDSVKNLSALAIVQFENKPNSYIDENNDSADDQKNDQILPIVNNAITDPSQLFYDVCCGRGDQVELDSPSGGLTFCDMKVDVPGADAIYEEFAQYFEPAETIAALRPSSPFLSEASESPEKCAEVCAISEDCRFFSYDARRKQAEHTCYLLADDGKRTDIICCDPDDYADENQTISGWTSGRPPRTRHELDGARVIVSPSDLAVDSANEFITHFEVSLGATPLRGAVWIEPLLASVTHLNVSISPQRVVLYDNMTSATLTVRVLGVESSIKGETLVLSHKIQSCDTAFTVENEQGEVTVFIDVVVDAQSLGYNILLPAILGPVLVVFAFLLVFLYIDLKRRQTDSLWKVKSSELYFGDKPEIIGRGAFGFVLLAEYHGTQVAVKRVVPSRGYTSHFKKVGPFEETEKKIESWKSEQEDETKRSHEDLEMAVGASSINRNIGMMSGTKNRGMGPTASFQKSKRLFGRDSYSRLKKEFIEEMRILSKLRHPCITTVIGAVVDSKEEPLLVMEYMDHGSLYDLLHNETVIMEGEQILPILRDVAQGLRFLHAADPQVIHGDLKAQNILVSSTFRAKVCDFGLSHTRNNWLGAVGTPYWMAPELLRGGSGNTAASDVYSFGIMLFEVYSRKDPYEGEDYKCVLRLVRDPVVNKRPPVPDSCPSSIASIMEDCLVNRPEGRPTFEELDLRLKGMGPDNVEPRKRHSSVQLKKDVRLKSTDTLDDRFPPHIAEALREGRKVEPESREMVSIFFSDIVRIADIASIVGPQKTSGMIDRLYDGFDKLAREHDLFKIETIDNTYMAVSNLAKDQPDHAKRILEFACDAVRVANETLIDGAYPEGGFVNIRVGVHSGPVLANVVGTRNPHYCLFGDTVNTVFRIQCESLENRIHSSEVAAKLVHKQYPELRIRSRGVLNIKGKGEMRTYWVYERTRDLKSEISTSQAYTTDEDEEEDLCKSERTQESSMLSSVSKFEPSNLGLDFRSMKIGPTRTRSSSAGENLTPRFDPTSSMSPPEFSSL